MAINPDTLNELLGKAVVDFGGTFHAALVQVGDKLGLYKALAAGGPQTPDGLPNVPGRPNVMCANGSAIKRQEDMCPMTLELVSSI